MKENKMSWSKSAVIGSGLQFLYADEEAGMDLCIFLL